MSNDRVVNLTRRVLGEMFRRPDTLAPSYRPQLPVRSRLGPLMLPGRCNGRMWFLGLGFELSVQTWQLRA